MGPGESADPQADNHGAEMSSKHRDEETAPSVSNHSPSEEHAMTTGDALDDERRKLAERLRETREFLGLSQQEAAESAGLTRLAISAIETGRRKVESVELQSLARVYGQSVEFFLPSEKAVPQTESVKFIARAARVLAPEDQKELLRFAEFLMSYRPPTDAGRGESDT